MVFTVNVEFSGGLELLFDNIKKQKVTMNSLADDAVLSMRDLLVYMRDNLLTDRPELFMQQDTVRPGILVLINDVDWELEGGIDSDIANGDHVLFVSTLHGG